MYRRRHIPYSGRTTCQPIMRKRKNMKKALDEVLYTFLILNFSTEKPKKTKISNFDLKKYYGAS